MSPTSRTYAVLGAGPVGATVALQLAERGDHVRLLTRSGSGPEHPLIERRRADASDPAALEAPLAGVSAVFACVHGSKYAAATWRAELPAIEQAVLGVAGRHGTVVVFPESLYSYGPVDGPIHEDLPRAATRGKLGVRTDLLRARDASSTPTVSVAASDFYGPRVLMAHAGERMVPTVLAGRTMRVLGDPDAPHSWTYVPDLAAAMITAADRPELWNSFLHAPTAPPLSQRELVGLYAAQAGVPAPRVAPLPMGLLRAGALVSSAMRELAETAYMFTGPFVMDSSASQARLGLSPTPVDVGAKATVEWWRARQAG